MRKSRKIHGKPATTSSHYFFHVEYSKQHEFSYCFSPIRLGGLRWELEFPFMGTFQVCNVKPFLREFVSFRSLFVEGWSWTTQNICGSFSLIFQRHFFIFSFCSVFGITLLFTWKFPFSTSRSEPTTTNRQ